MAAPKNLLVVDDDPHMCTIIGMLFNRDRFTVTTAADGHEALARIAETRYDVIISDIRMPGYSGEELLDAVMVIDRTQKMIMISGNSMDERALRERGAFAAIRKPFQLDHILSVVQQALADTKKTVCAR